MENPNSIKIERRLDGMTICAYARYCDQQDGWLCSVQDHFGGTETEGPVSNVQAALFSMIEEAIMQSHKKLSS